MKCPNCGKKLKFNYFTNVTECPKIRQGKEKKFGCGYKSQKKL